MSTTRWERQRPLSDQLRAVWDAHRDGVNTWPQAYAAAREALAQRLELDAQMVREMSWEQFRHLQGWHEGKETAASLPSAAQEESVAAIAQGADEGERNV